MNAVAVASGNRGRIARIARRLALGTVGVNAVLFMIVAFMHTPMGRPLRAAIFGSVCPVGNADPALVEQGRLDSARALRGNTRAPARPALGFVLDTTTLADVTAWATAHGVDCNPKREGTLVQCVDVPRATLQAGTSGTIAEVSFGFRPGTGELVNVTTMREGLDTVRAITLATAIEGSLSRQLGTPARIAGELTPGHLDEAAYATAHVEYRFSDYVVDVTTTRIPGRGLAIREHYMSAVD